MLFVGDDWAEDHHDVELMDARGCRLAKARLHEGVAGIARLHAMIGEQLGEDAEDGAGQVKIGIETRDLPPEARTDHRRGWQHYLGRLAIVATGGDPGPDRAAQP